MRRLILTSSSGADLAKAGLAEIVVLFFFRFQCEPLPTRETFAAYFAARTEEHRPGDHWSDWSPRWPAAVENRRDLSFVDFCEPYDVIELWFDPTPEDQLQMIWLLDCLSSWPGLAEKLELRLVPFEFFTTNGDGLAKSEPLVPVVGVTANELETARKAWRAYCAPTPEACAELVYKDLSALPMLRQALLDLLAELPSPSTGLGATEMRFLELIARGFTRTNSLFHLRSLRGTRVFGEVESQWLLQGLAHGPEPAIAGLDDELRTIDRKNSRDRHAAYLRSRLSLTEFGRAVLAHQEDFSRHNPIDRWWGGTRLTNDRLWRFGAVLTRA